MVGIAGAAHVVATPTTLALLRIKHPGLAARVDAGAAAVTPIAPWQTREFHAPSGASKGYAYSVTALPLANHCQGARPHGGWEREHMRSSGVRMHGVASRAAAASQPATGAPCGTVCCCSNAHTHRMCAARRPRAP